MIKDINNISLVEVSKEMEQRIEILKNSLQIEESITQHLADLLDIKKGESISLGNKSTALSLKTKTDLLIDLGTLNKNERKKILYFSEIRNQFIHNINCKTFTDFSKCNDSTSNKLLKLYKIKGYKELEEQLNFAYKKLFEDVTNIISAVFSNVKKKIRKKESGKIYEKAFNDLKRSIDFVLEGINIDSNNISTEEQKAIFAKQLKDEIKNKFFLLSVKNKDSIIK